MEPLCFVQCQKGISSGHRPKPHFSVTPFSYGSFSFTYNQWVIISVVPFWHWKDLTETFHFIYHTHNCQTFWLQALAISIGSQETKPGMEQTQKWTGSIRRVVFINSGRVHHSRAGFRLPTQARGIHRKQCLNVIQRNFISLITAQLFTLFTQYQRCIKLLLMQTEHPVAAASHKDVQLAKQVIGCTSPTSQQGNKLNCTLLLCGKQLLPCAPTTITEWLKTLWVCLAAR